MGVSYKKKTLSFVAMADLIDFKKIADFVNLGESVFGGKALEGLIDMLDFKIKNFKLFCL